jgi:hypothetical protein
LTAKEKEKAEGGFDLMSVVVVLGLFGNIAVILMFSMQQQQYVDKLELQKGEEAAEFKVLRVEFASKLESLKIELNSKFDSLTGRFEFDSRISRLEGQSSKK